MLGTDQYAYRSKIKMVDPVDKLFVSMAVLLVCIILNRWEVSFAAIVGMTAMNVYFGGHKLSEVGHLFFLPASFILLAVVTIIFGRYTDRGQALVAIQLGKSYFGFSQASLYQGLGIVVKSFGIIASVYFYVMNTAMTDISIALQRLHVPELFTEIMELVYRFIFVLWDTGQRIHVAQNSRLGYKDYLTSYHSTADLVARLFFDAMRRVDKIYTALESRGYTGVIRTTGLAYDRNEQMVGAGILMVGLQIVLFVVARRLG